jgi:hypothetical protein
MNQEKQSKRNKRKNREKENNIEENNKETISKERATYLIKEVLQLDMDNLTKEELEKINKFYLEKLENILKLKEENNLDELYDESEKIVKKNYKINIIIINF